MNRAIAALALVGTGLAAGPLLAQTGAVPTAAEVILVRVDVTTIRDALAAELGAGTDALPRSVEVPVDVAAKVCALTEGQLEHVRMIEQHVECKAEAVSPELAQATREQIED